jgi:hypothetical protein
VAQAGDNEADSPPNGGQDPRSGRKTGDSGPTSPAESYDMARVIKIGFVTAVATIALAGQAQASGGNYVFAGGPATQRGQVRSALEATLDNAYKPDSDSAESAAMAPARFRALMKQIVGA